jgi:hypothetical protein
VPDKLLHLEYRGTTDGFGSHDFQKKCIGKKNTVMIVQTFNNVIIGGYRHSEWASEFTPDPEGFLFSISHQQKFMAIKNAEKTWASFKSSIFSREKPITFGFGPSLAIGEDPSNKESSYYQIVGAQYEKATGKAAMLAQKTHF